MCEMGGVKVVLAFGIEEVGIALIRHLAQGSLGKGPHVTSICRHECLCSSPDGPYTPWSPSGVPEPLFPSCVESDLQVPAVSWSSTFPLSLGEWSQEEQGELGAAPWIQEQEW